MGIFRRNDTDSNNTMAQSSSGTPNQVNMIAADATFEGTLRATSDVRISGRLDGTLDVEGRVVVAEGGTVEGEITAANIDVAGTVEGELVARELLVLRASAVVEGQLQSERLVIEEGAVFHGECIMGEQARKALQHTEAGGSSKAAASSKAKSKDTAAGKAKAGAGQ